MITLTWFFDWHVITFYLKEKRSQNLRLQCKKKKKIFYFCSFLMFLSRRGKLWNSKARCNERKSKKKKFHAIWKVYNNKCLLWHWHNFKYMTSCHVSRQQIDFQNDCQTFLSFQSAPSLESRVVKLLQIYLI